MWFIFISAICTAQITVPPPCGPLPNEVICEKIQNSVGMSNYIRNFAPMFREGHFEKMEQTPNCVHGQLVIM